MAIRTGARTIETEVLEAVEQAYRDAGLSAHLQPPTGAARLAPGGQATVWIEDIRRVECIVGDRGFARMVGGIEGLASQGWEVIVLSPIQDLGDAHRQLRGSSVLLQGWWKDGARVRFSRPRIP